MPDGAMRKTLSRRFSAAASTYDDHARVQWAIAQSVAERARTYLPPPARVLDIGCGTGAVIQALGPAYERVGLDLSEAMIDQASKLHTDDIEWVHTDVLDYTDERPFDGFLSASTLHWIRPLDQLFVHLHRQLRPDGFLIFALMLEGSLGELNQIRNAIAPDKKNPRLPERQEVSAALNEAGFTLRETCAEKIVQQYPSAHDFIQALHASGVTARTPTDTLNRRELKAVMESYNRAVQHEDQVYATWEVGFFVAQAADGLPDPINA